ncbi:MAG: glutamate--tRNA ligase, partial [Nocardioidaceae bacterium]
MTDAQASPVRVRFCPSPTGNPHVGLARTALFNWAFARHVGGTFVFRIEDTDAARDSEESYETLLEVMRWLGFDWDEGPEVGGEFGPYRQSERMEIYADVAQRLLEGGRAYHCYCSQAELEVRNELARSEGRTPGYDGHCRALSEDRIAAYVDEGRKPVLRLRIPDGPITFQDLVRGEISFESEHVPDYVLVRANGHPLYTLVNPVDDALMQITHVLRGEDLLSSTPRQLALYDALAEIGVGNGTTPLFGHLPYVMGQGNKKLSKRDPESHLLGYRDRGFLPEGLLNYLALLGWAIAEDRDIFSIDEMVAAFTIDRVNPNPARFDLKKAEAVNGVWLRQLSPDELARRLLPYLQEAGHIEADPEPEVMETLFAAAPLVQERMTVLTEGVEMLAFLFTDDVQVDPADAAKVLTPDASSTLEAALEALDDITAWEAGAIENALRAALVDKLGLKPKNAFAPVRVAVTGRRVSPPLFESLDLLGADRTLSRL